MEERGNGHKPGMMTRLRAWLLGVEPEVFEGVRTMLNGYQGSQHKGNSLILGGPTAWTWNATLDDDHHGTRGADLHADSHARQHALDSAEDHTGTITDTQHGSRGADLHADSHARQHDMDSDDDHGAGTEGDLVRAGTGGAWERLPVGANGQLLTVVAGDPAWADEPTVAEHGNEKHSPNFYAVDGTVALTAPLTMQLTAVASEPDAVAGNEGNLYYLTPGTEDEGLLKQIMKNSTGSFEQVQIAIST